ncbi:MAG: alpha/beta family hydrolase [Actinomycetota bacterium]
MARRIRPYRPQGLVLFHGAGGDRDHRLFLRLDDELALPVSRVNFPYRRKGPGRRPPDRMPKLIEAVDEAVVEAAETWGVSPKRLVVGGRSMGGRAASLAMADGLDAAGLLLLSYPLHPPGKPEKLRVDHLHRLARPVLVVQGRKDPFGTPEEFAEHLPAIRGPVTERWVDGGHDPRSTRDDEIVAAIADWLGPSAR